MKKLRILKLIVFVVLHKEVGKIGIREPSLFP